MLFPHTDLSLLSALSSSNNSELNSHIIIVHKEITGENRVYSDYFVMLLGIITVILTLTGLFFYKTFILRYIVIVIGGILGCWIGYKSFYHMKK